ncbi:hypothetical protein [Nonomuraea sp. NPDC048901]|uniref:hypothetical protein n=1 Tax=Nonomuraea sp. NPDC048901 TaxID=3155627 RepID=UPI00340C6A8C
MADRVTVQRDPDGGEVGAGVVADLQLEDLEQFMSEFLRGVRQVAGQDGQAVDQIFRVVGFRRVGVEFGEPVGPGAVVGLQLDEADVQLLCQDRIEVGLLELPGQSVYTQAQLGQSPTHRPPGRLPVRQCPLVGLGQFDCQ